MSDHSGGSKDQEVTPEHDCCHPEEPKQAVDPQESVSINDNPEGFDHSEDLSGSTDQVKSAMSPKDQVESDMLNQESNRPEDHTEVDSKGLEPHSQKVQKEGTMTSSVSPLGTPGTPPQEYRELTCQRLAGLFFSGRYEDRVWVESVAAYRDRIIVDGYQTDVVKTLKTVLRKAKKAVPGFAGIQSKPFLL